LALRDHLLQWQPNLSNRAVRLGKLLGMLFDQIDIGDKGYITWDEFSAFLVDRASVINKHVVTKQTGEHKTYSVSEVRYARDLTDSTQCTVYVPELELIALIQDKHPVITFVSPKVIVLSVLSIQHRMPQWSARLSMSLAPRPKSSRRKYPNA
jgi:hypothetical protein